MSRPRAPLPCYGLGPSIASDWATGDTSPNVVWREGKWWTEYHYDTVARDLERDKLRIRRNRAVGTFLRSQSTDPGL